MKRSLSIVIAGLLLGACAKSPNPASSVSAATTPASAETASTQINPETPAAAPAASSGGGGGAATVDTSIDVPPALLPASHVYLLDLAQDNQGEIMLARLALTNAVDERVRNFADMIIRDHTSATLQVQTTADAIGIQVSTTPAPEAGAALAVLQGLSGAAFDQAYMAYNVTGHQKDVAASQQQASNNDDVAVSRLASNLLPTLTTHLQAAQNLRDALGTNP